jgi:Cdc6-like AAA superfamily ATPase
VPGNEIVGRDKELQELSSFLEQSAYPGALLIEGDPGIGKTTLWRAGVDAARELSYIVLRASPAEK